MLGWSFVVYIQVIVVRRKLFLCLFVFYSLTPLEIPDALSIVLHDERGKICIISFSPSLRKLQF